MAASKKPRPRLLDFDTSAEKLGYTPPQPEDAFTPHEKAFLEAAAQFGKPQEAAPAAPSVFHCPFCHYDMKALQVRRKDDKVVCFQCKAEYVPNARA